MTFFVDANVIVYARTEGPYRAACQSILRSVAGGEADGKTSTAALEEVWHLELTAPSLRLEGLTAAAYRIFAPLLAVTDDVFRRAMDLEASMIGANDRVHVATALANGIEVIVSADARLARVGAIRHVDPLDSELVARLMGRASS